MNKGKKEKEYIIIVNAREKTVTNKELTFDEIVHLAFEDPKFGPQYVYTITYQKGVDKPQGELLPGESIKIKDGMIFNVQFTDKS